VEADWPDAYRVNTFVRGAGEDTESVDALTGFKRFPQWMWRNADVLDFIGWLREHNDEKPSDVMKCGFYGLDLYSLHASIEAVLAYLEKVDPEAASRALHPRCSPLASTPTLQSRCRSQSPTLPTITSRV
jgi:erythromycin esterase-like protein